MRILGFCLLIAVAACGDDAGPGDMGADMAPARAFPESFLWGSATGAHHVEGNITNSDWAAWETLPGKIRMGDKAGLAVDHYHKYDEDLAMAEAMGHNAYRFSLEWSRIEPVQGMF